jgi:antitoxin (DNA-binding transcriptional repressor) of toxin-antitoxin stability system
VKSVGIRQLKARLSEYVRLARSGELILVTDREEIVAELGPVRHQAPEPRTLAASLERLAHQGQLTRAGESKEGWAWSPRGLGLAPETVDRLLDDARQDR